MSEETHFHPVTSLSGDLRKNLILVCDHASNQLPAEYASLGLPVTEFERHIAYDIGVASITRQLQAALQVPAILSEYSRLLIDPNRGLDDPTLIMELSDGTIIPANANITAEEKEKRIKTYYMPYHNEIRKTLDLGCERGQSPVLFSLHSFTPFWKGVSRPWHVSVLWDQDDRFVLPLLKAFRGEGDLIVGENEPYHGNLKGDCMYQHGSLRHLPHALVEIRQDLISTPEQQAEWAQRLDRILRKLIHTL